MNGAERLLLSLRPTVHGGWPLRQVHLQPPKGGSHEEALYHRRSVLGHDLGLCRQRMRSRFAALELQLVGIERRVHVLELRRAALELQLVALGLRFSTPTVQLGGVELRFERGAPVLELRFVALERQLVILELRFATFEFWFTTPKKRACFRPGSGRLRDWTRFGVPRDFGPEGRSIWRSPRVARAPRIRHLCVRCTAMSSKSSDRKEMHWGKRRAATQCAALSRRRLVRYGSALAVDWRHFR
jgi:hypothetical protein